MYVSQSMPKWTLYLAILISWIGSIVDANLRYWYGHWYGQYHVALLGLVLKIVIAIATNIISFLTLMSLRIGYDDLDDDDSQLSQFRKVSLPLNKAENCFP